MANKLQKFIRFVVVAVKLEVRQVRRAIKRQSGKKPEIVTVLHVRARAPFIPLELKDMVMEHLQGDVKSLTACSLIASDWTPAAQRRLFRSLILAIGPIGHHTNTPALGPRSASFPTNMAPRLARYITALHIRPWKSCPKYIVLNSGYSFLAFIKSLPSLEHLTLESVIFFCFMPPVAGPHFSLKTLRIENTRFDGTEYDTYRLFKTFTVRDTFEITGCKLPVFEELSDVASLSLRHLKIKGFLDEFPWPGPDTVFAGLTSLSFDITDTTIHNKTRSNGPGAPVRPVLRSTHCHAAMDCFLEDHGAKLECLAIAIPDIPVCIYIGESDILPARVVEVLKCLGRAPRSRGQQVDTFQAQVRLSFPSVHQASHPVSHALRVGRLPRNCYVARPMGNRGVYQSDPPVRSVYPVQRRIRYRHPGPQRDDRSRRRRRETDDHRGRLGDVRKHAGPHNSPQPQDGDVRQAS